MSTGRRAYDLLRGYINHEWERIQSVYQDAAEQELNEALESPLPRQSAADQDSSYEVVVLTQEEKARQILGVTPNATFDEIKKAFDKLNQRSDPANFPTGSHEADQAASIRSNIYKAYRILADKFDPTETRFKSLEID